MRTLNLSEMLCVSGGLVNTNGVDDSGLFKVWEAPCITMGTPCVGPPPTAEEMRNNFAALAAAAGVASLAPAPQISAPANAVSKVSALLTWIAHQFVDQGGDEKAKENDKKNDKKKGT